MENNFLYTRIVIALIKNIVLDILFPSCCLTCGKVLNRASENKIICNKCFDSIPIGQSLFCPVCLRRVPEKNYCHPQINYLLAPVGHYDHPSLQKLIWQFKYQGWLSAAEPLCQLITNYLNCLPANGKGFIVIPIPLHRNKEWQRGFNQSTVLATHVAKHLKTGLIRDNLIRIKNTDPQTKLDYEAREKNIKDAFHLNRPHELKGESVILVDDVFTSGATLNEAARTLKSAGVKKIIALVLARAR